MTARGMWGVLARLALVALLGPGAAPAAAAERDAGWSCSLGLLAGSALPDARLGDFQWDVAPRAAWGGQVLLERGRFATGARLWRSSTTQTMDLPSGPVAPRVGLTRLELTGQGRVLALGSTALLVTAAAGWLHLGYAPDHITIPPSGSGAPIVVSLRAVDEWIGGAGVALRRPWGGRWSTSLGVDREFFGLDAAHRSGSAIVYGRESLGEWSARLEVARQFQLR